MSAMKKCLIFIQVAVCLWLISNLYRENALGLLIELQSHVYVAETRRGSRRMYVPLMKPDCSRIPLAIDMFIVDMSLIMMKW
jgi:hypothetical protein